jgi:hypothetical protein
MSVAPVMVVDPKGGYIAKDTHLLTPVRCLLPLQ